MNGLSEQALRSKLVWIMVQMTERGMNRGTSGNVSARYAGGMLITPSGVPTHELTPEMIVRMDATGVPAAGSPKPSSEWRMHAGIYQDRPDAMAIVHCHSRHATTLACAGRTIPSMHYMVGVSGKTTVPFAP